MLQALAMQQTANVARCSQHVATMAQQNSINTTMHWQPHQQQQQHHSGAAVCPPPLSTLVPGTFHCPCILQSGQKPQVNSSSVFKKCGWSDGEVLAATHLHLLLPATFSGCHCSAAAQRGGITG